MKRLLLLLLVLQVCSCGDGDDPARKYAAAGREEALAPAPALVDTIAFHGISFGTPLSAVYAKMQLVKATDEESGIPNNTRYYQIQDPAYLSFNGLLYQNGTAIFTTDSLLMGIMLQIRTDTNMTGRFNYASTGLTNTFGPPAMHTDTLRDTKTMILATWFGHVNSVQLLTFKYKYVSLLLENGRLKQKQQRMGDTGNVMGNMRKVPVGQ